MGIWAALREDGPRTNHPCFMEIQDTQFDTDNAYLKGTGVWDIETETADEGGKVVSSCSMIGLRMSGVMIAPELLEATFGKSDVARARELAIEHFQELLNAGELEDVA